jgi:hypothetical protein
MKRILVFAVVLSNASMAFSHPGHGKPGWFHTHADLFADIALILFAVSALAALCWSLKSLLVR